MTWNYRLFKQANISPIGKRRTHGEPVYTEPFFFFVAECYYDEDGKPELHSTIDHNLVSGDSPEEVKKVYEMIAEAFDKPVIELDDEGNFK